MEFEEARGLMDRHRHNVENGHGKVAALARDRKKLKFRTFLYRKESNNDETPETYEIQYFNTSIITLAYGRVTLNDGGFFSTSTHSRLNEFMPRGFRVHGHTPRWHASPVGFVSTPAGTYAYSMPISFRYDGTDGSYSSPNAGKLFHKVPLYVDVYLDRLFKAQLQFGFRAVGQECLAFSAQECLEANLYPADLITYAVDSKPLAYGDYRIEHIAETLIACGADVFKRVKNKNDLARKIETMYRTGGVPPIINRQKLRADLRVYLIRYLLDDLGFVDMEWNRR